MNPKPDEQDASTASARPRRSRTGRLVLITTTITLLISTAVLLWAALLLLSRH